MLFISLLAIFGNAYQYQSGFDYCKKIKYSASECKFHEKNVRRNPKSIHYKDLDAVQE